MPIIRQPDIHITLQGINISHLGKRKIIFKYALSGGYVNSLEGISYSLDSPRPPNPVEAFLVLAPSLPAPHS